MRTLAALLYLLIVGCLLLASYATDSLVDDYYREEVSEEYRQYGQLLTLLIGRELSADQSHNQQRLAYWRNYLSEEIDNIELMPLPAKAAGKGESYVDVIEISAQTDQLVVVSPLLQAPLKDKALKYYFVSSFSDEYIGAYYLGIIAIYFFLALIITLISWAMYRYLRQISKVTRELAGGNFTSRMPRYRIPALQQLSTDINHMATALEDKTQENIILTGAIHHELRIPVTRLRLALDIALHGGSRQEIEALLQGMDEDLEELSSLMEEILAISRLRLNAVEIAKEALSLADIAGQVVGQMNEQIPQQRHTALKLTFKTATDFCLQANPTLLERALFNVISNGVKYCQSRVDVALSREKDQVILSVADDGPGIAEDERARIVKPFYRTDKSRNRDTGGFGLGLAIANMVVKDTHGWISITDSPLGGARVNIHWRAE
ncbi:sensor histidine kinase [Thalassomonas haliotis]|uniref:histidine kinase n=1 Tax=Thalassomonas haliotis TaxID=485448 RepID=A0ABY7V9Q6_9GAMM|nr:ATP-binding protein [Thalassomonas haliotis]WDE10020.1 ATP-binding protein [Thalassomonas haliotis]